jgi:pimeloyl-ACP methyl ester carboxylesterase
MAMSLLQHAPERMLEHLTDTPLLVLHGECNALHPPGEAKSLHDKYPGPKTLHWIPNAGHTEWMLDDNPTFQATMSRMQAWIEDLV